MKTPFLEAGKIINTHGIRGELKIQPWCDSPEFLCGFDTLYVDGKPVKVRSTRIHKNFVLATLEGVEDIDSALPYKNKVVSIARADADLPEGKHFIADLIGLEVRDADSGEALGRLEDILSYPAQDIYVVKGEHSYLIPAVDAFIKGHFVEEGYIAVKVLEGMASD
ncbi:MAG: 16S rRNA processing protein RimM [Oscillospiraceae bacterium]|nr:16S rRNA processing protein RimM [Oscillospiraceae bacterium]